MLSLMDATLFMGITFHELLIISYYSNVLLHDYSCWLFWYSNAISTAVIIYSGINILTSHLFPTLLCHHYPSHGKDGQHITYMVLYNAYLISWYCNMLYDTVHCVAFERFWCGDMSCNLFSFQNFKAYNCNKHAIII